MVKILLTEHVVKDCERMEPQWRQLLTEVIEQLRINPSDLPNTQPLASELPGFWLARVGPYRVVYRLDEATKTVVITAILLHR